MTKDQQVTVAKEAFNAPGQKVLRVDDSRSPALVVVIEDEYGVLECEVLDGHFYDAAQLREHLEGFKRSRAEHIGAWNQQKSLSAEIVGHLNGDPDTDGRMSWLPELVFERFLSDFHLHFTELEKLVKDPENFDKDAVVKELETIPFSWQHNP